MKMNIDKLVDELCDCFEAEEALLLADMMRPIKLELEEVKEVKQGFGIVILAYMKGEKRHAYMMAGDATELRGSKELKPRKNMSGGEWARTWFVNHVATEPLALEKLEQVLKDNMTPCMISANIDDEIFSIIGPAMLDEEPDQKAIH